MTTTTKNFTLPNGVVLTPESMKVLHQLQFNQGYLNFAEKNQDIAMYTESISKIQDSLAENAHILKNDDHDAWRKYLLHIAELVEIKKLIKKFSHPEGD